MQPSCSVDFLNLQQIQHLNNSNNPLILNHLLMDLAGQPHLLCQLQTLGPNKNHL